MSEGVKFLAVGAAATVVSAGIFNWSLHGVGRHSAVLADQPLPAFVVANGVGMLVSYRGSRSWVFADREPTGVAGGRVAFFLINVASMLIPLACLAFTRYALGRSDPLTDNLAANVVGLALGTLARFWAIKRAVFVAETDDAQQPVGADVRPVASKREHGGLGEKGLPPRRRQPLEITNPFGGSREDCCGRGR